MVVNIRQRNTVGNVDYDANCPAATDVDDFVYVIGPSSGGYLQVDTVDVADISTIPAFGVVIEKTTSTICKVRVSGEIQPVSALTPGSRYFVGSDGKPTDTLPTALVGGKVAVQQIGYALDTSSLRLTLDQIPIIKIG